MARGSLANPLKNLNLSRRQIALFQKIILTGNQMSEIMINSKHPLPISISDKRARLGRNWLNLMIELTEMLL